MTISTHVKGVIHNGRRWDIVRINGSYFARCYGQGETAGKSDTGPYSTVAQAEEFIRAIRPWTDETRRSPAETVSQVPAWRCFHCDEIFVDRGAAAEHFGCSEIETPACKLNAMEGGLLGLVRRQAEQIDLHHREDTASYREFYSLGGDHARVAE